MKSSVAPGFELSISAREDGTVEAVYIRFGRGKVAETKEVETDIVFAHYDARGHLLGIELLGPAKVSVMTTLVDAERRESFDRFVRDNLPSHFRDAA
jgi:uncharacterized protein YuzE